MVRSWRLPCINGKREEKIFIKIQIKEGNLLECVGKMIKTTRMEILIYSRNCKNSQNNFILFLLQYLPIV